MRVIFISYRRQDSADVSGRIRDHLAADFGDDAIFTDVHCIPEGADFHRYIDEQVGQCEVFLPVIGNRWLSVVDDRNQRRLDDPEDIVRREIESAIKLKIPIIPLLVTGAEMPEDDELPESLAELARRNGLPIRPDPDFRGDMQRLSRGIKNHLDWTIRRRLGVLRKLSAWAHRIWKKARRVVGLIGASLGIGAAGGALLAYFGGYAIGGDSLLLGAIFGGLFIVWFSFLSRWT